MWNTCYEQDDGRDLMNLLEIYISHVVGCLSGDFNIFYSFVAENVGTEKFTATGFRMFTMRTLYRFAAGSYCFLLHCVFTAGSIVKISHFLLFPVMLVNIAE